MLDWLVFCNQNHIDLGFNCPKINGLLVDMQLLKWSIG